MHGDDLAATKGTIEAKSEKGAVSQTMERMPVECIE
jgi:hypothetical protein